MYARNKKSASSRPRFLNGELTASERHHYVAAGTDERGEHEILANGADQESWENTGD